MMRKQYGLALPELIVATGISSMVVVLVSVLVLQITRLQASAEASMGFTERMIIVRNVVRDIETCSEVFAGTDLPAMTGGANKIEFSKITAPADSMFDVIGDVLEVKTYTQDKFTVKGIRLDSIQNLGVRVPVGKEEKYWDPNATWASYTARKENYVYRGWFEVETEKQSLSGTSIAMVRRYPMHFMVDPTEKKISGCYDPPQEGIACASVGGKYCPGGDCLGNYGFECYTGGWGWSHLYSSPMTLKDYGSFRTVSYGNQKKCSSQDPDARSVITGIDGSGYLQNAGEANGGVGREVNFCQELPEAICPAGEFLASYSPFDYECLSVPVPSTVPESKTCLGKITSASGPGGDTYLVAPNQQSPLVTNLASPVGAQCDFPGQDHKINLEAPQTKTYRCAACVYPAGTL